VGRGWSCRTGIAVVFASCALHSRCYPTIVSVSSAILPLRDLAQVTSGWLAILPETGNSIDADSASDAATVIQRRRSNVKLAFHPPTAIKLVRGRIGAYETR
jgi:hypothetical protein